MEDRFLITKKTVTDDNEHDDFEYYTIYDAVKNTEDSLSVKSVWGTLWYFIKKKKDIM